MANLNKVHLMGRLTRDPELRYTPKGTAVTDLGMAINRYSGTGDERKEETTFVDVTLWGKQAETANQYLAKGREVFIEGRLQLDSWEDKASGQKRSKLKVVGESMQFIGGTGDGAKPGTNRQSSQSTPARYPDRQVGSTQDGQPVFTNDEAEDIPF